MSALVDVRAALAEIADLEIVIAESGGDVAEIVRRLRMSRAGAALLLIDSSIAAIDRAMLRGAIEIGEGAATADVVAAGGYLATARSTTGQVLTVTTG